MQHKYISPIYTSTFYHYGLKPISKENSVIRGLAKLNPGIILKLNLTHPSQILSPSVPVFHPNEIKSFVFLKPTTSTCQENRSPDFYAIITFQSQPEKNETATCDITELSHYIPYSAPHITIQSRP